MSLSEKKLSVIINLLTIVPAIVKQVPGAIDLYSKMMAALKDDTISEAEWDELFVERDTLLASIEADTNTP